MTRFTVIEGGPRGTAPVRTRRQEPPRIFCQHKQVELDGDARRVYCQRCGREVPAYDALVTLAREWEHYEFVRDQAERDAKTATKNLHRVKREERNARARLRRLARKHPPYLTGEDIGYLLALIEKRAPYLLAGATAERLRAMAAYLEETSG